MRNFNKPRHVPEAAGPPSSLFLVIHAAFHPMLVAHPGSRLPVELIAMVMDHVDLAQLLQLSRLCVRWRAVAQSHPLYWRSIRLSAVSTTALDLFCARIASATGRVISVDIVLKDSLEFHLIRTSVLPAVARCLAHISHLGLFIHHSVADDALSMLLRPAPQLKALAIHFSHLADDQPAVPLNADLLAGGSPKLTTVVLEGVRLPSTRIKAFNLVEYLRYNSGHPQTFHVDLLDHFPALESLSLMGAECTGVVLGAHSSEIRGRLSLKWLDLHFAYTDYDEILTWIPKLESISTITCRRPSDSIVEMLLGHLPGELKLAFLAPYAGSVYVTMSAPAIARSRTFAQWETYFLEDWPRDMILESTVLGRITTLRLLARLALVLPHLGEMPACKQLELVVLAEPPFLPPARPSAVTDTVRFPALESVVITLGNERLASRTVPADGLHTFLTELLGPREKRAMLRFERIHLSGDKRDLARDFDGV